MKVAIFPCNNGLGHIKRSLDLADKIQKKIKIDFYSKRISGYKFKIKKNIQFRRIDNPMTLLEFKKKNYPKWVYKININNYDFVYCDTLPEISLVNKKVIIYANFLWNNIFNLKGEIFNKIQDALKFTKIYTNYLFSNLKLKNNKNLIKIGFFGEFKRKKFLTNKNILISLGTAELVESKSIISQIKKIIIKNKNYNFFIDKKYFQNLKYLNNVFLADHTENMFKKISIAIIKPGFSIISECLKNGIPIFCFDKMQTNEFKFNSEIIVKNKLGFKQNNITKLINNALNVNFNIKKEIFYKYKNLRWNGEKKIVNEFK